MDKMFLDDCINLAKQIFASIGNTYIVDEKYMDAITAISGSGPTYIYLIVEALINAGVLIGLDNKLSKDLVLKQHKGKYYYDRRFRQTSSRTSRGSVLSWRYYYCCS